jgi:hypothetical protein
MKPHAGRASSGTVTVPSAPQHPGMPQVSARHCSPFEWKCRALLQQAWPSLQHSIALACEAMATSGTCPASIKNRPASAVIIRTTARRLFGANSIHLILPLVPENKNQSESKAERSMNTAKLSEALTELALDLRWAWNHSADELWGELDPERWELTGNAWAVLQSVRLLPPAHRRTGQTGRTLSVQRPRATARYASAGPGRRMVIRAAGLPRLQTARSYVAGRSGRHKTLPARYQ